MARQPAPAMLAATDKAEPPEPRPHETISAPPGFQLVLSYNPGYQSAAKDMKPSTRQRFGAIDFDFPPADVEAEVVAHESGIELAVAARLVTIAQQSRALCGRGLDEGMSTRMLVHAGGLIAEGISEHDACALAMTTPLTDDRDLQAALAGFVEAQFGPRP